MSIKLSFRIDLESDYHISAGHGAGATVDSALQRDADGVPVIRGTTLVGLLRQALRDLANSGAFRNSHFLRLYSQIDWPSDGKEPPEEADLLFGGGWLAKRWRISSARPEGLSGVPSSSNPFAGSQVAAHVRVDPALRRAEAHKLFWREEGDSRLRFGFTIESLAHKDRPSLWAKEEEELATEAALLVAAARMIRYLGAGRRRGRGACIIHLTSVQGLPKSGFAANQEGLLTLFEHYWLNGHPVDFGPFSDSSADISRRAYDIRAKADDTPLRLGLLIRLDEPVIIARKASAGNQFEGLDYIPGFVLRGALGSRVARRIDLNQERSLFLDLFSRDQLRLAPLYPCYQLEKSYSLYPTIPAPLDLLVNERHPRKELGHEGVFTAREAAQSFLDPEQESKLDALSGSYLALLSKVPLVQPKLASYMHVTIDPATGRAKDQELFSYRGLSVGQYLLGELYFERAADWEALRILADLPAVPAAKSGQMGQASPLFTLHLGKAIRRGYGKVSAVFFRPGGVESSLFAGLPLEQRLANQKREVVMTLISDAIVPDFWGRSYQGFENEWLSEVLGVKVRIAKAVRKSGGEFWLRFARRQVVDSFNNVVGLPRHRDIALCAGSAVTVELVDEALDDADLIEQLKKIETQGIGLRRHEGFGRVVFNHPVYQNACQKVSSRNTSIRIPRELRAGRGKKETVFSQQEGFKELYRRDLDAVKAKQWQLVQDARFGGMAREIHSAWVCSLDDAKSLLGSYGQLEYLLSGGLPGRQKENFFLSEKGKAGIGLLSSLFEQLASRAGESKALWAIGCRMLADRLFEAMSDEEGQR